MPDNIDSLKAELRKSALAARRAVSDKPQKSALIAERVFALPEYRTARTVALYHSLSSEVDTEPIIARAFRDGKTVALPRVQGDTMHFFALSEGEKLQKSSFGVLEPCGDPGKLVSPRDIDLILVPGVCFDRTKNRLGFGRGYYDRYLALCKAPAAALCFAQQLYAEGVIPTDRYDAKMQKIITENETI